MKKYLLYIFILMAFLVSLILYSAAINEDVFTTLEKAGLVCDIYRYGDMYTNTNLPAFKEASADNTLIAKYEPHRKDSNMKLYIIGDSYTQPGRVDKENFIAGNYQNGYDQSTEKLDTNKNNILIFECVERYLRMNIRYEINLKKQKSLNKFENFLSQNPSPDFYNTTKINDRLQYLLANNPFSFFFQEMKARFNYSILNFTGNGVFVSSETRFVYLAETLDSTNILSPQYPLDNDESVDMLNYLNSFYDQYKAKGFDEVYFSLIPEKIRVYPIKGHDTFNSLFEVIRSPKLKMPLINCLEPLKKSTKKVFITCDTHWNTNGINIWLKEVDDKLQKHSN
jgi:hypothetical protein